MLKQSRVNIKIKYYMTKCHYTKWQPMIAISHNSSTMKNSMWVQPRCETLSITWKQLLEYGLQLCLRLHLAYVGDLWQFTHYPSSQKHLTLITFGFGSHLAMPRASSLACAQGSLMAIFGTRIQTRVSHVLCKHHTIYIITTALNNLLAVRVAMRICPGYRFSGVLLLVEIPQQLLKC